jgi:hypothetical protein
VKSSFKRIEERDLFERVPGTERSTTTYRKGRNFTTWRKEAKSRE